MTVGDKLTGIPSGALAVLLSLGLQGELELLNDPPVLPIRHKLAVDHPAQDLQWEREFYC